MGKSVLEFSVLFVQASIEVHVLYFTCIVHVITVAVDDETLLHPCMEGHKEC